MTDNFSIKTGTQSVLSVTAWRSKDVYVLALLNKNLKMQVTKTGVVYMENCSDPIHIILVIGICIFRLILWMRASVYGFKIDAGLGL